MSTGFRRDRLASAVAAGALQLILLYLLFVGLSVRWSPPPEQPAVLQLDIPASPPETPPSPLPRKAMKRPEGASAPPNLRAHATEIVAPPTILPLPTPVIAAPVAGPAFDPSSGATGQPGPGTGAGGIGNGTGGGRYGDGDGGGGDDGGTPPRLLRGRIKNSDYPDAAGAAGVGGTVGVRYAVNPDGRVTDCRITASSGSAALDDTTCRLIERRFRFAPARDEEGHPVRSTIVESHEWISLPPPEPRPR